MQKKFLRIAKRNAYKMQKIYYQRMRILYELFSDFHIADCEGEIITYIESMTHYEIDKMFDLIINNFDKNDMAEAMLEPMLLKFAIMVYIQQIRNGVA